MPKPNLITVFNLFLFLAGDILAADKPYIPVGSARTKKTVIAIQPSRQKMSGAELSQASKTIYDTVSNDLAFMDLFKFLEPSAFIEGAGAGVTFGTFKVTDWSSIGAEFVAKSLISEEGSTFILEGYLYDTLGNRQVISKRYVSAKNDVKVVAHTYANDIVTALTGLKGIFLSKIAMICDRGTRSKEVYMMDFDGSNIRQVTNHRSLAISPAWSPDGKKLAYSVIRKHANNIKNMDLMEFDFTTNTILVLSNRKGINSGAAYAPDGKRLALTMSFLGNPEIFTLDPRSQVVTRITRSMGEDVDPAWSGDGRQMAFVSSRPGMPMVYKMNSDGTGVSRLTFAGRYNASPSWSPQGSKIVFSGWVDGHFDIFVMNSDGTNIERLTKEQGNNEDPFFSPDGNFIVFRSNRTGQDNVYAMNIDGTFTKRMTYGLGNCSMPKWSPVLK